jgi:hypothetical protein
MDGKALGVVVAKSGYQTRLLTVIWTFLRSFFVAIVDYDGYKLTTTDPVGIHLI